MTDNTDRGTFIEAMLRDIQATLAEHSKRFDRIEERLDRLEKQVTLLSHDVRGLTMWRLAHDDIEDRVRRIEEHIGLR